MRRQVSLGQLAVVSMFTLVAGCLIGFLAAQALMTTRPRSDSSVSEVGHTLIPSATVSEHVTATHTPLVVSESKEVLPSSTLALDSSPSPTVLLETSTPTPGSITSPTVLLPTFTVTPDTRAGLTATLPPLPKAVTATPVLLASVTITVTEEQAMQIAQDEAARADPGELTIRDPIIDITEQYVELTGKVINLGVLHSSDLRLIGVPFVESGKLRFDVLDAAVSNIPVPESQFPQIEGAVEKVFERILFGYDAKTVATKDGLITIQALPWQ